MYKLSEGAKRVEKGVPRLAVQPGVVDVILNYNTTSALRLIAFKFSTIHLITFGAPPVTSPSILHQALSSPPNNSRIAGTREQTLLNDSAFYAILNEGDPIHGLTTNTLALCYECGFLFQNQEARDKFHLLAWPLRCRILSYLSWQRWTSIAENLCANYRKWN